MDEVHVDYPVYSVLEEFAKSLSSNVDSVKFKFKGSKGLGDFHIDDSAVARAVGLPRQDYGGNDYHFEVGKSYLSDYMGGRVEVSLFSGYRGRRGWRVSDDDRNQ